MAGGLFRRNRPDMLTASPLQSVVSFGIPIFFGSIFQQLYSMVDSIVVGKFVGSHALAAVGSSAVLSFYFVRVCMGFSAGSTVVVAQQYGAGRQSEVRTTISTTLIFLVLLSIAVSAVGMPLLPVFARMTHIPDEILQESLTYLRITMAGLIFTMLYNLFAGILQALGDSVTPLIFLVISSILSILGDLFCVIRLGMGVAGVALATLAAQAVSVLLCAIYVRRRVPYFQFERGTFRFDRTIFRMVLRMGVPAAIQGGLMEMGFIFVQSLVNSFSTVNIAAYAAASKMENFSMMPLHAVSQGYSVFVGQNMGAGNVQRTKKGLGQVTLLSCALALVSSAVIWIIGPNLIRLFVKASETEVIRRGTAYLRTFSPFLVMHAVMQMFCSTLRGAGDSVWSTVAASSDLAGRLIAAYALSLGLGLGFMGCAWAIPIGWTVSVLVGGARYFSGKWTDMAVVRRKTAAEREDGDPSV